jgi:hypothetical protein
MNEKRAVVENGLETSDPVPLCPPKIQQRLALD